MPGHVYAIIACSNTGKTINTIISNAKRFMAYELIKRLIEQNNSFMELADIDLRNLKEPQYPFLNTKSALRRHCGKENITTQNSNKMTAGFILHFRRCWCSSPTAFLFITNNC